MKKTIILILFLFTFISARDKYIIYFTDKGQTINALDELKKKWNDNASLRKALERRINRGTLSRLTFEDLPIHQPYLNQLRDEGINIHHKLKWFNAVSAYLNVQEIKALSNYPFITNITPVKTLGYRPAIENEQDAFKLIPNSDNLLLDEINYVGAHVLKEEGYSGSGVVIGVFDTGFNLEHESFQNINTNLIATYDFIHNDTSVMDDYDIERGESRHGTAVASIVGGYYDDGDIYYEGLAPNASFILCKTEDIHSETRLEEDNWAAAAEFADSIGVDIVTTSLGYSTFEDEESYDYSDMDGNSTIITQAANYLTDRGVVVITSAGNEGDDLWYFITAPADGFEVIAVGSINLSGYMTSYSSHGPTVDHRIKPEIVAPGIGVSTATYYGGFGHSSGTSFACPIVAGGLALILEAFPQLTVTQIRDILMRNGNISMVFGNDGEPDNYYGYGVARFDAMYYDLRGPLPNQPSNVGFSLETPVQLGNSFEIISSTVNSRMITITIYNILGQKVYSNHYSPYQPLLIPGYASAKWSSGLFLIKIESSNVTKFIKMTGLK